MEETPDVRTNLGDDAQKARDRRCLGGSRSGPAGDGLDLIGDWLDRSGSVRRELHRLGGLRGVDCGVRRIDKALPGLDQTGVGWILGRSERAEGIRKMDTILTISCSIGLSLGRVIGSDMVILG